MKPVDALITGFVKSPVLLEKSLAPLRQLRQEQIIRDIHYVTWDSADLDPFAAPIAAMADVRMTRVKQPDATGNGNQRGIVYQMENLRAALALVPGDDGLVLKSRPDFIIHADFLRRKIAGFETACAVPDRLSPQGIAMPPPVFRNKIWVPWADSNQPFFFEDALFLGNAADIRKLVTPLREADMAVLAHEKCGSYAHVVRYAQPFAATWPLFDNYRRHYRCFVNEFGYRQRLVQLLIDDGFFWHMLIAHAWILHSQFHVDAGRQGEVWFYPNTVNRDADWSRPETLRLGNPYDNVEAWRAGTKPGEAAPSVARVYGRLMDDAWQSALFTQPLPDFPPETLRGLMENAARHRDGRLGGIERTFYAALDAFHRRECKAPAA